MAQLLGGNAIEPVTSDKTHKGGEVHLEIQHFGGEVDRWDVSEVTMIIVCVVLIVLIELMITNRIGLV